MSPADAIGEEPMKKMTKFAAMAAALCLGAALLAGCAGAGDNGAADNGADNGAAA